MTIRTKCRADLSFQDCRLRSATWAVLLLVLVFVPVIPAQEAPKGDQPSQKVTLRWRLMPGQIFKGKNVFGIRTESEKTEQTLMTIDFEWRVQSVGEDGRAAMNLIANRERFRHRCDQVDFEYDSEEGADLQISEPLANEVGEILEIVRHLHQRDLLFVFSKQGRILQDESDEIVPAYLIEWPELPEQSVGVGDKWTVDFEGEPEQFELVQLESIDGQRVAVIECKSHTQRYRFLIDAGRYLDRVEWQVLGSAPSEEQQFTKNVSERSRLELVGDNEKYDRWQPLLPFQKGRARYMISRSFELAKKIREYLLNERAMLEDIIYKLWCESSEPFNVPDTSERWKPIDWFVFARYYERIGEPEKQKQLLRNSVASIAAGTYQANFFRDIFLLQVVELLVDAGDFTTASKACIEIKPEAMSGLSITSSGAISVPRSALRSYALMLVARGEAKAGLTDAAIATAQLIPSNLYKTAALWIVGMQLAEQGKTDFAKKCFDLAEALKSNDFKVLEFVKRSA